MEISFSKMHGLGNDFIVVNELQLEAVAEKDKASFAKKFCERHFGIGADGVLFLCKTALEKADFRMRIFNADGSEAETCVNGLRCIAFEKFLIDGRKKPFYRIETAQGVAQAKVFPEKENTAKVELLLLGRKESGKSKKIAINGKGFEYYAVDVGNPHAVVFLKEPVGSFPVEEIGHAFEFHKAFQPHRTNTEFVNVVSPVKVKMRVHERGACETMACGSGSIAIVIAGVNAGLLHKGQWVSVEQPGGALEIMAGKEVFLRGPAKKVFQGNIDW